jgi:hypothetical protein
MTALKEWAESKSSATLVIEAQHPRAAQRAETFAFEVAAVLQERDQTVLWILTPDYNEPLTTEEIMCCLAQQVQQTLPGSPTVIQESYIWSAARLAKVFHGLDNLFLVVQLKEVTLVQPLLEALESAFRKPGRILKLLLISYDVDITSRALEFPRATVEVLSPPLPMAKRRKARVNWWECIYPSL